MNDLKFIGITEENRSAFHSLMRSYAKELDQHQHRSTDPEILTRWTDRIIAKQHDMGQCLKLCCCDDELIGFLYGAIDKSGDKGYNRVGWGCIVEFYVIPKKRRKGFGRDMLLYLEDFFRKNGVTQLYLTADPVTGKPFWEALGFVSKGEFCPDNGQEIYEKMLSN
ncbi:MAG: GNAT family N-acetyltransferase [Oscillospiraceae bacterium]|nr:GNAT family N-acetyltransferase [Oscillospiraceae bacterium]